MSLTLLLESTQVRGRRKEKTSKCLLYILYFAYKLVTLLSEQTLVVLVSIVSFFDLHLLSSSSFIKCYTEKQKSISCFMQNSTTIERFSNEILAEAKIFSIFFSE